MNPYRTYLAALAQIAADETAGEITPIEADLQRVEASTDYRYFIDNNIGSDHDDVG